ncbi:MAG: type II secretion system inner membrane protein GspF [Planctomycetaceae bacterium]|nr:type II secretion system inner membrane protein GspF [Planctomycetota bacterium]NUN52720.1 type II secretion system inner membrane protein GspF [Planctomycetaceae bacterium]
MPVFQYRALDASGKVKEGILDADTAREARARLREQKVHVVDLSTKEDVGGRRRDWVPSFLKRRHSEEVAGVTRQLATMLKSGIPLAQSLSALIDQAEHPDLEAVLRDVREKVTQGANLADAMAFHPAYFNDLFVNMVKAGQAAGTLDVVLKRLADYLQKQNRTRARVKAALAYPVVMVIIGSLVVVGLMTFVVPRILAVVKSAGKGQATLPLPTQILIGTSNFIRDWWWAAALAAFGIWFLYRGALRSEGFRFRRDRFMLGLPLVGDLLKKSAVSRFAVTLSTLLKSGVPALHALTIVQNVVDNQVLARVVREVHDRILEGADISGPMKRSGVFPPVVGYMISIGEQTGQLDDMLERVAEAYDEEMEVTTTKLTSILEPILIVAMAMVVGFIVLAVLLPIMDIGSNIRR